MSNNQGVKTPGYNCRLTVFFQYDKNGRKVAYRWSGNYGMGRAIRMSLNEVEMLIAQELVDVISGHPFK